MSQPPSIEWVKQLPVFNTSGNDLVPTITTDMIGNIYIAYQTSSGYFISGGTTTGNTDIAVFKLDSNGNFIWSRQAPIFNTTGLDLRPTIAHDIQNNIYISYHTTGTVSGGTNRGSSDIVIFKLDSDGTHLWNSQYPIFNTSAYDGPSSISVDNNGNVFIVARTEGIISGGTNSGNADIYVSKIDNSGIPQWTSQYPIFNTSSNEGEFNIPSKIIIDTNGDIYFTYVTVGTISGGTNLNLGETDIVVTKINGLNGFYIWSKQLPIFNTTSFDSEPQITVDGQNNVYVSYTTDSVVSGGTNRGSNDIVIFKLDSNGNHLWNSQNPIFNTNLTDEQPSIKSNLNGDIYISYITASTISGGTRVGIGNQVVVIKLNNNGIYQWGYQNPIFNPTIGVSRNASNPQLSIDTNNNIYITYTISSSASVSGGTNSGDSDIVVFKLSESNGGGEPVCFLEDTLIKTIDGEKKIQDLRSSDYVINYYGEEVPIKYLAKGEIKHLRPRTKVYPYLIPKNTFGINLPSINTYISPSHIIYIDEIPYTTKELKVIMNDDTIKQQFKLDKPLIYYNIVIDTKVNYDEDSLYYTMYANNILSETCNPNNEKLKSYSKIY